MTTYLGKSCSFCLPRVLFVNCRQFMYLVMGKCIPWTKSLGPLDLGPVQVIFSWTKWGVFLGPIPVGPGIKLPVEPCFYN